MLWFIRPIASVVPSLSIRAHRYAPAMDDRHARYRRSDADRRRRPIEGFRALGSARFDRLVNDAIATLPRDLLVYLDDVEVAVEDVPPIAPTGTGEQVELGRYRAAARTGRGRRAAQPPDRLTLFRRPLEARANDKRDLADLVQETVVQELAQHFGIDDDRLGELGWQ
jgi:predicted Zn-dependent protease with MMP-like domain